MNQNSTSEIKQKRWKMIIKVYVRDLNYDEKMKVSLFIILLMWESWECTYMYFHGLCSFSTDIKITAIRDYTWLYNMILGSTGRH